MESRLLFRSGQHLRQTLEDGRHRPCAHEHTSQSTNAQPKTGSERLDVILPLIGGYEDPTANDGEKPERAENQSHTTHLWNENNDHACHYS